MRILLATDGSEFSRAAVEKTAEFICDQRSTSVKIIAAYEAQVPMAAEPFAISAEYYQRLDEFSRQRAQSAADEAAKLLKERCPNLAEAVTTAVDLGRPSEMILSAAEAWKADLIVVGSHGRGFWGRLALGSVSNAVVHHAPCSVLVVRSESK